MTTNQRLDEETVARDVLNAIGRCLAGSGKTMKAIASHQAPLAAIPGFDSLCALEVTVELERRFGTKLDENIFVKLVGSRAKARTLKEVCRVIISAVSGDKRWVA